MSIQIISKRNGFRRCGIAHSTKAAIYPDDRFTKEELEILRAEPMLIVTETEGGSEEKAKPNAKETIALVEAVGSLEELSKLSEGEERKTVQEAIAKRGEELTASAEKTSPTKEEKKEEEKQLTVKEVEEKVKTIGTVEELNAMAEGEGRKTALEAIEKRRAELTAAKE